MQAPDADGDVRAAPPNLVGRTKVRVRQARVADGASGSVPAGDGMVRLAGAVGGGRWRRRLTIVEVSVGATAGRGRGRSSRGCHGLRMQSGHRPTFLVWHMALSRDEALSLLHHYDIMYHGRNFETKIVHAGAVNCFLE